MKKLLKDLFSLEAKPKRGLMAFEWVIIGYAVLTSVFVLFLSTKLQHPTDLITGRLRALAILGALWGIYRLIPCRAMRVVRVVGNMAMLAWWYPDTYELNRVLPNLDHVFAAWEQQLFGCQPALLFHEAWSSPIISELFDMGYWCYYPMIALTAFYYFFCRKQQFERAVFILVAAFFAYYVVFILVPVVGPTFYYKAVGVNTIAAGTFPNLHDYFNFHQDCLPSPGYKDGLFYELVENAKAAGERPTAAFPSSHVGISTVCLLLLLHARSYRLVLWLSPIYVCLCCATVYIQAHYLVDAIAGFVSAIGIFYILWFVSRGMTSKTVGSRSRSRR